MYLCSTFRILTYKTLSQMREGKAKTIDTPLRLDKHTV